MARMHASTMAVDPVCVRRNHHGSELTTSHGCSFIPRVSLLITEMPLAATGRKMDRKSKNKNFPRSLRTPQRICGMKIIFHVDIPLNLTISHSWLTNFICKGFASHAKGFIVTTSVHCHRPWKTEKVKNAILTFYVLNMHTVLNEYITDHLLCRRFFAETASISVFSQQYGDHLVAPAW